MADDGFEGPLQAAEDPITAAGRPWALWSVAQNYGWLLIVAVVAGIWLWPRAVSAWQRTEQQASAQGVGMNVRCSDVCTRAFIVH